MFPGAFGAVSHFWSSSGQQIVIETNICGYVFNQLIYSLITYSLSSGAEE